MGRRDDIRAELLEKYGDLVVLEEDYVDPKLQKIRVLFNLPERPKGSWTDSEYRDLYNAEARAGFTESLDRAKAEDEALRVLPLCGEPRWVAEIEGGASAELASRSYTPAELRVVISRARFNSKARDLLEKAGQRWTTEQCLSYLRSEQFLPILEEEFREIYNNYSKLGLEWETDFFWITESAWY